MAFPKTRPKQAKQAKIVKRRRVAVGARKRSPAAPPEHPVARLRARLQLTQAQFAPLFGISIRTLASLESGGDLSEALQRRMVEVERLRSALSEVLQSAAIGVWMLRPNQAFGGSRPLDLVAQGEVDRLWAMIHELRSGVAS